MHARAVGVKDARDLDLKLVLAPVVEEQCLGAALAFIVARARTYRVDVPPVILALRMNAGVAVDLRGRCLQDPGTQALRQAQHVDSPMHARLRGPHGVMLVMDGGSRAGEVVDLIHLYIERKSDVVPDHLEM